ncbi:MAG: DEAD/DEAH box helicase [Chloroflexia bacterium]
MQAALDASEIFSGLSFRYPLRKYERMILERVESLEGDHKYHIVAPPGSGKTIVGLEMVRRFGAPAVIFVPTTTIQQQWQEKVGMFAGEEGAGSLGRVTSQNPHRLAPINIFTYQLISTQGQAQEMAQVMARKAWVEELVAEERAADASAAEAIVGGLQRDNPHEYERDLAHRYLGVKRRLLQEEEVDLAQFLHPNARRLIEDLVGYGVQMVVLDECHHLLDYWAIVLRYLIRQIPNARVVGLTATLPDPESEREYDNYMSLVGDVDFEVPTPAVVKEGDLAPYRDLVYFVQPTERESAYLRGIQEDFEKEVAQIAGDQAFVDWVASPVFEVSGRGGAKVAREDMLDERPALALAAMRFLRHAGYPLPASLLLPVEAEEAMGMADWLELLERYALEVLEQSERPEDHSGLAEVRRALQPFGISITKQGLRRGRSPSDLVLALSEAKEGAVGLVLAEEGRALGERLRAVVVTDFEAATSAVEHKLAGVLERDAGSAARVFRKLASDPRTKEMRPVSVTGSGVLIGAESAAEMLEHFNDYLGRQGLETTCGARETGFAGVVQVTGDRGEWSPGVYVAMLTEAFEAGITKCLVGTRGIFGEGWDSLGLNTLIDLTGATTSTAVQQLRGRSIRLDPSWPAKVAHNWDVVCVTPRFERGDGDLGRFARRHSRYWGVVPTYGVTRVPVEVGEVSEIERSGPEAQSKAEAEVTGEVVKGVSHVDPDLAWELAVKPFGSINYDGYTVRMLNEIRWRDRSYEMWGVGQDYSNKEYSTVRLEVDDLKIRTAYTVESALKRMLREFRGSAVLWGLFVLYLLFSPALYGAGAPTGVAGVVLLVAAMIALAVNARPAYRLVRASLREQRPEAILADVGRAVLTSLQGGGLLGEHLRPEHIQVVEHADGSYRVMLDGASPEDAATFIAAFKQVFEPVSEQRYLVLRDERRLTNLGLALVWLLVRPVLGNRRGYVREYYPVPVVLAARRERAEDYARNWGRYVGGGRLAFTRGEEGRRVLLEARGQRRPKVSSMVFEVWR